MSLVDVIDSITAQQTASEADHTVYVSTSGDDANPGTLVAPVLTIERAEDLAFSQSRKSNTIAIGSGVFPYNRQSNFAGGSAFGGRASPLLYLGTRADQLNSRVLSAFNDVDPGAGIAIADIQDSSLAITPFSTAGTFVSGAPTGQIRYSDPALIGALSTLAVGDMWMVRLSRASGTDANIHNGTFTVAAVNSAAGTLDLRNTKAVLANELNNGAVYGQKSFVGASIRFTSGTLVGLKRKVRDHGVAAQGTIPVLAVASMTNNDRFTLIDANGLTKTWEYQVTGGFVAVAGRVTINISALSDTSAIGVAAATAAAIMGVLPSVCGVSAYASGSSGNVQLVQMQLGSAGNTTITKAGAGSWTAAAVSNFGSGTEVSPNRPGFGAPRNTFRINKQWVVNPTIGDVFVVERCGTRIDYATTVGFVQWSGGIFGMKDICLNNGNAVPSAASLLFNSSFLLAENLELRLNTGTLFFLDNTDVHSGNTNSANMWANQSPNPFNPVSASPFTSESQGDGIFFRDGAVTVSLGSTALSGFVTARQCSFAVNGGASTIVFGAPDFVRSTITCGPGIHFMNGSSAAYYGRLEEQTANNAAGAVVHYSANFGQSRSSIFQLEINSSGGDGVRFEFGATSTISSLVGYGHVGVGVRSLATSVIRIALTTGLTVTGLVGDMKVGNRAARTYTSFATAAPIGNEFDVNGDGAQMALLAAPNFSETRSGTILASGQSVDITFTAHMNGTPVTASINTLDATAVSCRAVWQGSGVLRVTANAAATADTVVSAVATFAQT